MDFLSIRKKARERAEAKEAAAPEPRPAERAEAASPPPRSPSPESVSDPVSERHAPSPEAGRRPGEERRRSRGSERVLTDADLVEGALQARFQGLEPTPDGRFTTWRPGAGPPPVEPFEGFGEEAEPEVALPARRDADRPTVRSAPTAAPGPAHLATAPEPTDPLDLFFYRPDEEAAIVPVLGGAAVEEPIAPAPAAVDEYLTVRLGREEFAVPIAQVREVMRAPGITEVPRAPAHVLGIVTVRGEVVVVIDTRARLGLAGDPSGAMRIVIVEAGEGPLGLLVDEVASVVRLPRGSIEPCPQGIQAVAADCVTGIGRFRDRLFMVIDVAALVGHDRVAEER